MARKEVQAEVTKGSGNVFADIGFEQPEQALVKAGLVRAISSAMASLGKSQAEVAALLGIDQPQVSRLLRGQVGGNTTDRLIRILNLLGRDVKIVVSAKRRGRGTTEVEASEPRIVAEARAPYGRSAGKKKPPR